MPCFWAARTTWPCSTLARASERTRCAATRGVLPTRAICSRLDSNACVKSPELYALSLFDAPSEKTDDGVKSEKGKGKRSIEEREKSLKNALEQKERQVCGIGEYEDLDWYEDVLIHSEPARYRLPPGGSFARGRWSPSPPRGDPIARHATDDMLVLAIENELAWHVPYSWRMGD